jgi:rRNA maturation endonuclease Nob1
MSREKQIEEMAEVIDHTFAKARNIGACHPSPKMIATDLYDAVYRKQEQMTPQFVLCPKGWEGVKKTRYYCPSCKGMTREHEKFCHKCGQAVKYPKLARSNNKLVLDWSDTK